MQLGKLALRLPLADVLRDQLIDPQKGDIRIFLRSS
jgi:hypothetical protein